MPEIIKEEVSDQWFVSRLNSLAGGLNHHMSEDQIPDDNLRVMTNIRPEGDRILKDTGYKPTQIVGASTTLSIDADPGFIILTVLSNTGFVIGGAISVDLDDGTVFTTTVVSHIGGTVITIPGPGMPSIASSGSVVTNAKSAFKSVLGEPRKTFEFRFPSGATETLLITDKTLYIRRNNFWSMAPLDTRGTTTLVNNEIAAATLLELVDTSEFKVGGPVTVELDSGLAHTTTIDSLVAGTSITIAVGIPTAASIGNAVTSAGVATTLSANEPLGETVIAVASSAGFAAGNVISIALADGTEHVTTVDTVAAGIINLVTGLTSPASSGADLIEGMTLTGVIDKEVVATPTNNGADPWVVFTNGVDPVARYDGLTVDPVPGLDGLEGNPLVNTCRTVVTHTGHLVLGSPTEVGALISDKVRWADTNNPKQWQSNVGNAGEELLRDTRDDVVAMLQLGQEVAIYRSRSIVMMEFVENVTKPQIFFFRPVIFGRSEASIGVGAVSANAVTAAGSGHIVLSHDGIYQYSGGLSVDFLSLKVDNLVFAAGGEIDDTRQHRSFCQFIDARNEVIIFYCVSGDTYPRRALVLSLETGAFWTRKFTRPITSAESHISTSDVTIAELEGQISQQLWLVGAGLAETGSPLIFFTSPEDGNFVYEYDFLSTTDAGDVIVWNLRSKRWKAFFKRMRWQWHQFKIGGDEIFIVADTVEASYLLGVVTPDSIRTQRFAVEVLGESIQYVMTGVGAFSMGDIAFAAREETTDFFAA